MKKTSFAILTLTVAATAGFAVETPKPAQAAVQPPAGKADSKVVKATVPAVPKANFDFLPETVAEVNGQKLTKAELVKKLLGPTDGKIPDGVTQEMLNSAANAMAVQFIQTTAVLDAALKAGYKPSQEMAEKEFSKFLKKVPEFQLDQIKKVLARQGMTIESFIAKNKSKKEFQEQMAVSAFFEDKVFNKCTVTDKEVKEYYDKNPDAFKTPADSPDSLRASHILIAVKENDDSKTKAEAKAKAEKLLALLKKDAKLFGELAAKESACPSGKNEGSLGAFQKGQMVPEFEKAVVNLKDGEISAIVETKFGYHIIRRDPLQKEKVKTFDEVKDKIKMSLEQKEKQEALQAFINKITDEAKGKNYLKK
ncbi:MAG: peptidylprolyl isomerase [Victivallaceae bacterium]|nr:peptidylprolyl isomerase [Victivallaceae bacterium]